MPIQVNFNNGNPIFSPALGTAAATGSGVTPPLVDLSDVNKLGLNKQYIRNKPIHICYNLDWWKTTQKNSLPWKQIHECIKLLFFKFTIKIYNKKFKYGTIYEYLLNELEYFPENFRDPTQKEKTIINNRYKANIIYDYTTEQNFYSGLLLVDCKLSLL